MAAASGLDEPSIMMYPWTASHLRQHFPYAPRQRVNLRAGLYCDALARLMYSSCASAA
jgi:hypothetical protein